MNNTRSLYLHAIPAFVLGFALGGVSIHYAAEQGTFGMASVKQMGNALVEMQKNVDDLQKNMGTLKSAKDNWAPCRLREEQGCSKKLFREWASSDRRATTCGIGCGKTGGRPS